MSEKEQKKSSRILTFDLMRGYFLLSIIINHLNYSSAASFLTMKGELFVSSAEGFFFLSGIVLGIVRGAKLITQPFSEVVKLLLKRSLQLYVVYVILTIAFTFLGWWFFTDNPGLKPGIAAPDTNPLLMIWNVLTFSYLYGWVDYLRLYFIFILLSPIVIWLLRKSLWWVVLIASILVWQFAPELPWPSNVYTQPYNWQVIFFTGMVVGFHWKQITAFWKKVPSIWRTLSITLVVGIAITTLLANIYLAFGGKDDHAIWAVVSPIRDMLAPYFDKENMPIARMAMFLTWFWAAFWIFKTFERYIVKFFGWLLMPLGTNSLYVYIVGGIIIYFVHLFIPMQSKPINLIITVAIVTIIWLMIRYKILMKIIPR